MAARQNHHTITSSAMFIQSHGTTAATEVFGESKPEWVA